VQIILKPLVLKSQYSISRMSSQSTRYVSGVSIYATSMLKPIYKCTFTVLSLYCPCWCLSLRCDRSVHAEELGLGKKRCRHWKAGSEYSSYRTLDHATTTTSLASRNRSTRAGPSYELLVTLVRYFLGWWNRALYSSQPSHFLVNSAEPTASLGHIWCYLLRLHRDS
jgi:hypothetical protein